MVSIRLHVDDCGHDNGPLLALRGSFRLGRVVSSAIKKHVDEGTVEVCLARTGDVVAMRGLTIHASERALQPSHRHVIHVDFSPAELPCGLEWALAIGALSPLGRHIDAIAHGSIRGLVEGEEHVAPQSAPRVVRYGSGARWRRRPRRSPQPRSTGSPLRPPMPALRPTWRRGSTSSIADKRAWNLHGVVIVRSGRLVLERYFAGRGQGARPQPRQRERSARHAARHALGDEEHRRPALRHCAGAGQGAAARGAAACLVPRLRRPRAGAASASPSITCSP